LQIAAQALFDVLADQQLVQILQIWQALQEENAVDEPVSVLHLVDRLMVFVLVQLLEPPVAEHASVQEILVDRRELVTQYLI
jgi:hypothetical protein